MWSSKAPYIVVIAVGALAWALSYFYNTIVQQPVVEYSIKREEIASVIYNGKEASVTTLEVCNVTFDKVFREIVILLWGVKPRSMTMQASGFANLNNMTATASSSPVQITIKNAQPQVGYVVKVHHVADEYPVPTFDAGSDPIRFIERGLLTRAIRLSQEVIVYGLFAIPVLLAILWSVSKLLRIRAPEVSKTSVNDDAHT